MRKGVKTIKCALNNNNNTKNNNIKCFKELLQILTIIMLY